MKNFYCFLVLVLLLSSCFDMNVGGSIAGNSTAVTQKEKEDFSRKKRSLKFRSIAQNDCLDYLVKNISPYFNAKYLSSEPKSNEIPPDLDQSDDNNYIASPIELSLPEDYFDDSCRNKQYQQYKALPADKDISISNSHDIKFFYKPCVPKTQQPTVFESGGCKELILFNTGGPDEQQDAADDLVQQYSKAHPDYSYGYIDHRGLGTNSLGLDCDEHAGLIKDGNVTAYFQKCFGSDIYQYSNLQSIHDLAFFIKLLQENNGIEKVYLVGSSYGGYFYSLFAHVFPDLVTNLALDSPIVIPFYENLSGFLNYALPAVTGIVSYFQNEAGSDYKKQITDTAEYLLELSKNNNIVSLIKKTNSQKVKAKNYANELYELTFNPRLSQNKIKTLYNFMYPKSQFLETPVVYYLNFSSGIKFDYARVLDFMKKEIYEKQCSPLPTKTIPDKKRERLNNELQQCYASLVAAFILLSRIPSYNPENLSEYDDSEFNFISISSSDFKLDVKPIIISTEYDFNVFSNINNTEIFDSFFNQPFYCSFKGLIGHTSGDIKPVFDGIDDVLITYLISGTAPESNQSGSCVVIKEEVIGTANDNFLKNIRDVFTDQNGSGS